MQSNSKIYAEDSAKIINSVFETFPKSSKSFSRSRSFKKNSKPKFSCVSEVLKFEEILDMLSFWMSKVSKVLRLLNFLVDSEV